MKLEKIHYSLILPLCILFAFILSILLPNSTRVLNNEQITFFPNMLALSHNGDSLNFSQILYQNKKIAVFFFNPNCDVCVKELDSIIALSHLFENTQWLFITIADSEELNRFSDHHPILSIPNSFLLREDFPQYHILFDVSRPPAVFVYDEKMYLRSIHKGDIKVSSLLKELS